MFRIHNHDIERAIVAVESHVGVAVTRDGDTFRWTQTQADGSCIVTVVGAQGLISHGHAARAAEFCEIDERRVQIDAARERRRVDLFRTAKAAA